MLEIVSYFMSYIIEQVKRRRQERNWSQKYIADCINVSQSFIYKAVIYIFTPINVGLIFFFLFRFRVLSRQTGSPGTIR